MERSLPGVLGRIRISVLSCSGYHRSWKGRLTCYSWEGHPSRITSHFSRPFRSDEVQRRVLAVKGVAHQSSPAQPRGQSVPAAERSELGASRAQPGANQCDERPRSSCLSLRLCPSSGDRRPAGAAEWQQGRCARAARAAALAAPVPAGIPRLSAGRTAPLWAPLPSANPSADTSDRQGAVKPATPESRTLSPW